MLVQNDSYVILSHFDCHPFKADSEPHLDVREHIFALKKKKNSMVVLIYKHSVILINFKKFHSLLQFYLGVKVILGVVRVLKNY